MQFLRTLIWVLLAVTAVVFAVNNWNPVSVRLWAGITADVMLPVLLAIVFALGFVPTWLWQRARRWRVGQRLAATERTLAEYRPVTPAAEFAASPAQLPPPPPAPGAVPSAVPPGV